MNSGWHTMYTDVVLANTDRLLKIYFDVNLHTFFGMYIFSHRFDLATNPKDMLGTSLCPSLEF